VGSGAATGSAAEATIERPPPTGDTPNPSIVAPLLATAGTATAIVIGVVARSQAYAAADRAELALSQSYYDDDVSSIRTWNAVFVTGIALGVIGAGASAYLWYRAFHTESHVEVQATPGGPIAVSLSGRW
jgi:type VI protein secretion system component VasF